MVTSATEKLPSRWREGLGEGLSERQHPATSSLPPLDPLPQAAGEVWRVVARVPDPEIPVLSIVDLGIVREATDERIVLTPTYTGCPATQVIELMVRAALDSAGLHHIPIETTLTPPWTTDWISDEGRAKLKAYGIAPPVVPGSSVVECPQCGSAATEEISRFGSTPCKSLWRCRDCLEPFDHFKCH